MRAGRPARRRPGHGALLRRRRVPVDLRLPPRRRRGLPRAARAAAPAAAADAELPLAARGARGGQPPLRRRRSATSFQPLAASRRRSRPGLRPPGRAARDRQGVVHRDSGDALAPRRGARTSRARVRELVDAGAATPGEIVLLFAAGTDAEWYEEELRALGPADLPRDRAAATSASSRSSTCSAYLRLLRNRYDDEALVAVLASPFVGVSNDALVLDPRATRRGGRSSPGIERSLPAGLSTSATSSSCARSSSGTTRLVAPPARVSLERLCERIVSEHDYDLAVLAQWDGRRRYANLRKLTRLARSYEELRGRDVEGFVRFVREQEARRRRAARGGRRGGRRRRGAAADDPRRQGARVQGRRRRRRRARHGDAPSPTRSSRSPTAASASASPTRSRASAHGVFDYDDVRRRARPRTPSAERLRLYYVAMTRAIDRLIVSGAIDADARRDENTPIGWVLDRLECEAELDGAGRRARGARARTARAFARPRVDRAAPRAGRPSRAVAVDASWAARALRTGAAAALRRPATGARRRSQRAARSRRSTECGGSSYSALALFERCSYRYYAERVAGMRPTRRARHGAGGGGLAATEIGDAVHRLLELVDLSRSAPRRTLEQVRAWYPAVTDEELERIARVRRVLLRVRARARGSRRSAARARSGRSRSSTTASSCTAALDVLHRDGDATRSSSTTRRTSLARARRPRRSSRPTTGCSGSSTRSPASAPGRRRSRSSTTSSSSRTRSSRRRSRASRRRRSRRSSRRRSAGSDAGEFVPTPSEFIVRRLPGARRRLRRAALASEGSSRTRVRGCRCASIAVSAKRQRSRCRSARGRERTRATKTNRSLLQQEPRHVETGSTGRRLIARCGDVGT